MANLLLQRILPSQPKSDSAFPDLRTFASGNQGSALWVSPEGGDDGPCDDGGDEDEGYQGREDVDEPLQRVFVCEVTA